MKNDNFIVIMGWMINELHLSGNELLIYAIIYGFSQDGIHWFSGSRQYIADTIGVSRPTIDKAINGLMEKGYIIKDTYHVNETRMNKYKAVDSLAYKESLQGCKESLQGGVKILDRGVSNIFTGGCKESLHNNIDNKNNIKDNIDNKNIRGRRVYYPEDENLNKAFTDFVEMRKKIKKPMTDRAVTLAMNQLDKLAGADKDLAVEIVNQSVLRGWQTFYPLKDEQKGNPIYNEMKKDSWANSWANA